jgi:hypothetical protein
MAGTKYAFNKFKPRSIKLKNRLNGDVIEGILVNEEDIDGKKYFVVRFLNGAVNKFNKEAFTSVGSSMG